jgi:hypothetical protein
VYLPKSFFRICLFLDNRRIINCECSIYIFFKCSKVIRDGVWEPVL